jgi:hypothetical protein
MPPVNFRNLHKRSNLGDGGEFAKVFVARSRNDVCLHFCDL